MTSTDATTTSTPTRRARAKRRGNGEGTFSLRPDGRWQARVPPAFGRKAFYGKTREEASRKLTAALADSNKGLPLSNDQITVAKFLETWLEDVVRGSVRPSTFESYAMHVRLWWAPSVGRVALSKFTAPALQRILNSWHSSGSSAATIQRRHATLRQALGQAVKWGLIAKNVATLVKLPRTEHTPIVPLNQAEAAALLSALADDRLEALCTVALALGLRQGEALGLTWADIDLDASLPTLSVRQALQRVDGKPRLVEPKSRKAVRTIPLPPMVVASLREHRARQSRERLLAGSSWQGNPLDLVFASSVGTPLDGPNVTHRLQAALKAAGLPRVRFHDLRHSCASFLLAAGVPMRQVADVLGHAQITLTLNTYAHVMPSEFQRSADVMEAVLAGRR